MIYATWKLDFSNPNYGTGPESKIAELGAFAEGAWANGDISKDATILGYLNGEIDASELSAWNFAYITEAQALAFCQAINPAATFGQDGKIIALTEDNSIVALN